jgi:hypothetical protein
MSVINAKVTTAPEVTKNRGGELMCIATTFETAAADDAGSIYRIATINSGWVPVRIDINCDAIAGATDIDVGFYQTLEHGGAVADKDILAASLDIHGGAAIGSEANGLASLPIADIGKRVYELLSATEEVPAMEYDLALTADSEITAAGTISVRAWFAKT